MLDPKLVGRSAMERTKLRYRTDVGLLGARRQIAHRHVVDHALAQRRDRPGHRKLLSNWTARTRSPRRQEGICRYPTPIEMSRGQKRKLWKRQAKTLKISKSTSSIWAPNAATGKLPRQRFSAMTGYGTGRAPRSRQLHARARNNGNLPVRPLDDLHQHLLALFDAEMAVVPIELIASGVEITDRSCPLKVDLDALAHFLEGDEDVIDF